MDNIKPYDYSIVRTFATLHFSGGKHGKVRKSLVNSDFKQEKSDKKRKTMVYQTS